MSGKKHPSAAILICVYAGDHPDWFSSALDSLEAQTYPKEAFGIYLGVDGPLTGEVEKVVSERKGIFRKIIRSPVSIHLPAMLNLLIDKLEDEEYVFRMDSDDLCDPTRLEKQISEMEAHKDVGVLGTAIMEFDSESGWSKIRSYPLKHEDLLNNMHLGLPVAHPSVCIRRSALDILMRYDEKTSFNQDVELWFRAMSEGVRFGNLREPLLHFRCNTLTLGRRTWAKSRNELKLYLIGCYRLYGLSPKLITPFVRFLVRQLPIRIISSLYHSDFRRKVLGREKPARLRMEASR
jgi:hypothetical protein